MFAGPWARAAQTEDTCCGACVDCDSPAYQILVQMRVRVETMVSPKCGIVRKSQSVLMMINGGLSALRPGPFGGGLRRLWLAGASSVRALPRARCLPRTVTLATRFLRCQRGAARSFRLPCVCPHRAGWCRCGATRVVCVCVEWRPNYLTTERAANADTRSTMSSAVGGKEDRSIWSSTGASSNRSRPHGPLRSAISS